KSPTNASEASIREQSAQSGPSAAIEQLRNHQKQLDADGCMVGVSRQALDEVLDALEAQAPPAGARDAVADGEKFADWLAREMPPGTTISNPYWWAPRIIRALAALASKAD